MYYHSRLNNPEFLKLAALGLTVAMGGLIWCGRSSGIKTPKGCLAALLVMVLATLNLLLDPFHSDDTVNYLMAFLIMASVVWVSVDMLALHNRECSNPLPQFETHQGGEDNA